MKRTMQNPKLGLSQSINQLSISVLGAAGFAYAVSLVDAIRKEGSEREAALHELRALYPEEIKRPVYYLVTEIGRLPYQTRAIVFYCASYLETVLKICWEKQGGGWPAWTQGQMIRRMRSCLPAELRSQLNEHNRLFGRKSKHDFLGYDDSGHLYDLEDVVLCLLITRKLIDSTYTHSGISEPCTHCGCG